ncbi:MAG: hypothetical protein HQ483_00610 [Rhodospirillales bacterium]|nr:hypothetical protein [Rhodospirillales bacterium]
MPKNKKPNRKPGIKKTVKRPVDESVHGAPDEARDTKSIPKTYGSPKAVDSRVSPAMTQRSARSR